MNQGGNYWTLFTPGIWKVLHAVFHAKACARACKADHLLPDTVLKPFLTRRALAGLIRRSPARRAAILCAAIREADQRQTLAWAGIGNPDLFLHPGRLGEAAIAAGKLIDQLRCAGSGTNQHPLPDYLGEELARCLALGNLDDHSSRHWVRQVLGGWRLAGSADWLRAEAALIRDSGLFDAAGYARRAGIACSDIQASIHYVLIGDALGIAPSDGFDPAYYADRNPELASRREHRLLHYIEHGKAEGRAPLPPLPWLNGAARCDGSRDNIIVVAHETSRTGAPILAWNIARHLAGRYNLFIVLLGGGPLTEAFASLGAATIGPFQKHDTHPVDVEYALRRLIDGREIKYAIVNSCESRLLLEPLFTRLIPTLLLMHEFASTVYTRDLLRTGFDMASEIVFPAEIVANSSLAVHPPLRARKLRILPQGMSMLPGPLAGPRIAAPPALARLAESRRAGAFIVLGAGAVIFRKGVDLFLGVAMAACHANPARRIHFLWVGQGYQPNHDMAYSIFLREQLERSGLEEHVSFVDELSDLEPAYALADLFLLTSRLDPMPNVSIDASWRGIPTVCFENASGTAELLRSEPVTAAGVVRHLDTAAAARTILALADDPELLKRTAAATQALARSVFDMDAYCAALDTLGIKAWEDFASLREDADTLCRSEDVENNLLLGATPVFESRTRSIRRAVARATLLDGHPARSSAAFDPHAWRQVHAQGKGHPLAEFIRAGRPPGPWSAAADWTAG